VRHCFSAALDHSDSDKVRAVEIIVPYPASQQVRHCFSATLYHGDSDKARAAEIIAPPTESKGSRGVLTSKLIGGFVNTTCRIPRIFISIVYENK
jgi:hypothetical protein